MHAETKYLQELSHPNVIQIRGVATGENEEDGFSIILDQIGIILEEQIRRWKAREDGIKKPLCIKKEHTCNENLVGRKSRCSLRNCICNTVCAY